VPACDWQVSVCYIIGGRQENFSLMFIAFVLRRR
jgi:hypothetical protein